MLKNVLKRLRSRTKKTPPAIATSGTVQNVVLQYGRGTYVSGINYHNSYGRNDLTVTVGSFSSVAGNLSVFLAGNHPTDFVSTYPFGFTGYTRDWSAHVDYEEYNRSKGSILIGSDVWIGASATIMSGITIGHGAVVGAQSLVARDVPPYAIFCGNPAKLVGYRFKHHIIQGLLELAWWEWEDDKIEEALEYIVSSDVEGFLRRYLQGTVSA